MKKGVFITFEGTDGSGKSTLIRVLNAHFKKILKRKTQMTREPGGPRVAEKIRSILVNEDMHPRTELLLYEAARAEHVEKVILPALKSGSIVLCDRFIDSTVAYQGEARNLSHSDVIWLNKFAVSKTIPHLTVWLDVDPRKSLRRATNPNRFEAEGLAFQQRVRKGFKRAMRADPKRFLKLSVSQQTPQELAEGVIRELKKRKLLK